MIRGARALAAGNLVAALLAGCAGRSATSSERPAISRVVVVTPTRTDVARTITLPGDVVGRYQAALYAKVSGYLASIDVDKGDWVTKGQVLARIEVPELEQKLRQAQARLKISQLTYERMRGVRDADPRLIARQEVDVEAGKLEQARAEAEELSVLLGYTRIAAPFDGVITARHVDPGALVRASAPTGSGGGHESGPLLEIADITSLRVYVYVPEQEVGSVRRGIPAALTLREFPGRTFTGTIARFASSLDLSTRTMLAEVDLENPTRELYPGMYADVSLDLERHAGVFTLPTTSVAHSEHGGAFVLAVSDGKLRKRAVETGLVDGGSTEIRSGLTGAEQVVRNLGPSLSDGELVEAVRDAAGA